MKCSIIQSSLKVLFVLSLIALTNACASKLSSTNSGKMEGESEVYSPAGVWEYELETPESIEVGLLTLIEEDGEYTASVEIDGAGIFDFQTVEIIGTTMTGSVDIMGSVSEVKAEFDGETLSGIVNQNGLSMKLEATRISK